MSTHLLLESCTLFPAARIAIEKAILNEAFDKIDEEDNKKLKKNVTTAKEKIQKIWSGRQFSWPARTAGISRDK
jgi:hemerythrin-like domain-containing protein